MFCVKLLCLIRLIKESQLHHRLRVCFVTILWCSVAPQWCWHIAVCLYFWKSVVRKLFFPTWPGFHQWWLESCGTNILYIKKFISLNNEFFRNTFIIIFSNSCNFPKQTLNLIHFYWLYLILVVRCVFYKRYYVCEGLCASMCAWVYAYMFILIARMCVCIPTERSILQHHERKSKRLDHFCHIDIIIVVLLTINLIKSIVSYIKSIYTFFKCSFKYKFTIKFSPIFMIVTLIC